MKITVFSAKSYDRQFLTAANADGRHELAFYDTRLTSKTAKPKLRQQEEGSMDRDDYAYFRRRAKQEDKAARGARCDEARTCHQNLAAAYRDAMPIAPNDSARSVSARNVARCQTQL